MHRLIYKSRNWIYLLDLGMRVVNNNIYKSRNWIYLLDLIVIVLNWLSTKVEIGYIYQTQEMEENKNLSTKVEIGYIYQTSIPKRQKLISTKVEIGYIYQTPTIRKAREIYKSRNWIYLLDLISMIMLPLYLQKQKLDISIRL